MLYLVSTPIGNIKDISFRAIETLKNCDYILCEDTRHSLPLLRTYDIHKPLKSFHQFNETHKEDSIISDLCSGKLIGLISDAGTPGISDPGSKLIKRCIQESIPFVAIPGPCAAIHAISCSGLNTNRFQFLGFLPKKQNEIKENIKEVLTYPGTTILYESPKRLLSLLQILKEMAPNRHLVIARELTKKFEEFCRGTPAELIDHWRDKEVKGEIVLLISGQEASTTSFQSWSNLSAEEHVLWLEKTYFLSRRDAIKMAAEMRGIPKRLVYKEML